jgi:geranylgeranyl diphosphate synthase type I
MFKILAPAPELARRTAAAITQFQADFPQFAFDQRLLQPASEFVTRGKLFRGSVCLSVAQAFTQSPQPTAAAWSAAVALELAGSALLIQDDITDQAELRRNAPALHKHYATCLPETATPIKLAGESLAMYVSDVLFFLATKTLTEAACLAETRLTLLNVMSQEIATLALSQSEELRFTVLSLSDPAVTETEIIKIMIGKTARYTAQWPLQFAGILAGVDQATQATLQAIGQAMGLVFQLSDDRLGLFGDSTKTGKDDDSDAKAGKKTLYALYAYQRLSGAEANIFSQLYGKADLTAGELQTLQDLLQQTGITAAVDQVTARYVQEAKQAIHTLAAWPELQALLTETVDFLATREK